MVTIMRICAFIGASGTGKSYRAQWVARENNLECIIDDGLFIKSNKVLAGRSAKKENSKIASVRRAIFTEEGHRQSVKDAIIKANPEGILILGTSEEMIKKICEALELPLVGKWIQIDEVASQNEINKARHMRKDFGKHVIPVPTIEVKNQFSGYFLNSLKIFRSKGKGRESFEAEKTIVRPTFSYMGEYTVSEKVINEIIYHVGGTIAGIHRMTKIRNKNAYDGIIVDIDIIVYYGTKMDVMMKEFAEKVQYEIDKLTALNIISLNITVKGIFST